MNTNKIIYECHINLSNPHITSRIRIVSHDTSKYSDGTVYIEQYLGLDGLGAPRWLRIHNPQEEDKVMHHLANAYIKHLQKETFGPSLVDQFNDSVFF